MSFNLAAVIICSDFGAQENEVCLCFHCFPICLPWSDGTGCHDLSFWMLNFKPGFSFSSFTFIKRLFSSCLFSALRVASSAYRGLLTCLFFPLNRWSALWRPGLTLFSCLSSQQLEQTLSKEFVTWTNQWIGFTWGTLGSRTLHTSC